MARDIHAQSIPLPRFPMSAFDMGYSLKTSAKIGKMVPHYVEEVIPSDIAHIKTDIFVRLDPMVFPIMHKIKVRQNFFFVPDRLVLGDRLNEEFFSCNDLGSKLPSVEVPSEIPGGEDFLSKNSIFDYMECQPKSGGPASGFLVRNPLPFFMYQLIYKDWYADEILDASSIAEIEAMMEDYQSLDLNQSMVVSSSVTTPRPLFKLRPVSYSKDRYTSAQPDAQRVGEVYVMNPLQVEGINTPWSGNLNVTQSGAVVTANGPTGGDVVRASLTIDELWDEMAVQRFLNSLNEFGNERYVEILAGQFGVISADARLQRPQWLGGNEMVVDISEVLQTSQTSEDSPLGSYAGRGIVAGRGRDISFKVPEHGFIIGILSFVPENGYASGSPRWLYKSTPLDFAMPRFNNLGEQAVYQGELFSDHYKNGSQDLDEFGYQPQYDEYRCHVSRSVGDFRESQFLSWHLDRKFLSAPPLNSDFIHVGNDVNRIFNDTEDIPHLRVHCFHKAMYVRPISKHPIPGKL